jgi:NAD+-asparagine ADP-ribosyltransferase|nr:MAG TPA: minor capsid protein [Caudoviricetes sp.]
MTTENKKKIDEYWTERALQQEQNAQIVADRYMAQIGQSLADYKHQLVSEIEKFYARYAVDNKMTHAEAKQYLTDKERREFKNVTLERFREMALNPDTPTPLLDALGYRHRISRKEALLAEIERLTAELYGKPEGIHDKVTEALSDVYIKGKIHQAKNLAHFGIIEKPILGVDAVKHKMASNWSGKTFSTNVWGHDAAVYKSISDTINKGLTGGWSIDRMARALSERTGVAYHRADTLVRTETTFYNNLATLDSIKELGGDHYEIVAVLDSRTSEICRLENHEVHSVKEYEPGRTAPPFHVRCRSTIRPAVKSDKPSPYFNILQNNSSVKLATDQRSLDEIFAGWEREGEAIKEKLFAKDGEKMYNQDMSSIDLMAKQRSFVVGDDIRVNTKKLSGTEYDFWVQDNTKKIRDTVFNVQSSLKELNDFPTPTVVFLKKSRLPGFAGYDYKQDILFVSDALHSEIEFAKVLSDNYFAAQNITDTMVHELTHKKHWDSAKAFYKANKKRYNNVEQAMSELNSPLVSYVKEQLKHDYNYLYSISDNAAIAFYNDNINELVAEVGVLGDKVTDPNLLNKVKEVLSWK